MLNKEMEDIFSDWIGCLGSCPITLLDLKFTYIPMPYWSRDTWEDCTGRPFPTCKEGHPIKQSPALYFFIAPSLWSSDRKILYIGKSVNMKISIHQHLNKYPSLSDRLFEYTGENDLHVHELYIHHCDKKTLLLKNKLIDIHRPPLNRIMNVHN